MTLLDKQTARSVLLQPDYFGFLVKDDRLVGYGLGNPQLWRNLPYIATMTNPPSGAGQP
jgi:hypoxanthine phosphoribosyltransferase